MICKSPDDPITRFTNLLSPQDSILPVKHRSYPCQVCLPHGHCTVSVGLSLVSCREQIGQGLVITYVIRITSDEPDLR